MLDKIDIACKKKGAKFLIVNRRYFDLISKAVAKNKDEYFLEILEKYHGLVVAVTDKRDFEFEVI